MANQHNGSLDTRENIRNVGCIARHAAQWIGHGHNRISVLFEDLNDPIPARSIGKSAMHKHDGGLWSRGVNEGLRLGLQNRFRAGNSGRLYGLGGHGTCKQKYCAQGTLEGEDAARGPNHWKLLKGITTCA